MSTEISNEIEQILKNNGVNRHSYFQLQYFLIGKQPTIQSKLWACIRELGTRKDTIDSIILEIEDLNDNTELINIKLEEIQNISTESTFGVTLSELEIRRNAIRCKKLNRKKTEISNSLKKSQKRLNDLLDECAFIVRAYKSLEKIEPLKDFDDIETQKEFWNDSLTQEFNLRLLFDLPQNTELLQTILSLNSDCQIKKDTLKMINSRREEIENYMSRKQELKKIEKDKFEQYLSESKEKQ